MSEFSDRPLVAGSLIGLRAFDVDSLGRLTGIHWKRVFTPGDNTAQCTSGEDVSPLSVARRKMQRDLEISMLGRSSIRIPKAGQKHQMAGVDCSCGFYAYFDGGPNTYAGPNTVTALIEGYGVCTVGERGFRAEKARLVAIVEPGATQSNSRRVHYWYDRIADWSDDREGLVIPGCALSFCAAVAACICAFIALPWTLPLLLLALILVGVGGFVGKANFHTIARQYPDVSPEVRHCVIPPKRWRHSLPAMERVVANYPDVPVYPTLKAALREHPLTTPEPERLPTPETDPGFWTMEAPR